MRPFWKQVARAEHGHAFVDRTLDVAAGLDDRELAAALLEPLLLAALTAKVAKRWRPLLDRYGLDWCWKAATVTPTSGSPVSLSVTWPWSAPVVMPWAAARPGATSGGASARTAAVNRAGE